MLEEGDHSTHFELTPTKVDVAKINRRTIELVLERWAGQKNKCMRNVRKKQFEGWLSDTMSDNEGVSREPPLLAASA